MNTRPLFTGIFITCWVSSVSMAGPGFFKVSDPSLPDPVRQAAKGVYRFVVQAPKPHFRIEADEVVVAKELLEKKDPALLSALNVNNCGRLVYLAEMARLKPGEAFLGHGFTTGSGFFIDNETFITNRSNFNFYRGLPQAYSDASTEAELDGVLKDWKPRFLLMDASDQIVFDSALDGNSISAVVFDGHPLRKAKLPQEGPQLETGTAAQLLDFVVVRLKGVKGNVQPLKSVAAGAVKAGDAVYSIGYPLRTKGRKSQFRVPDSDGSGLLVSQGKVTGPDAKYQEFLRSLMPENSVRKFYEERMLFHDADTSMGNAGGPVVDANGNILGIITTARHDPHIHPQKGYSLIVGMGTQIRVIESMIP